jgi:hypothetical protein
MTMLTYVAKLSVETFRLSTRGNRWAALRYGQPDRPAHALALGANRSRAGSTDPLVANGKWHAA